MLDLLLYKKFCFLSLSDRKEWQKPFVVLSGLSITIFLHKSLDKLLGQTRRYPRDSLSHKDNICTVYIRIFLISLHSGQFVGLEHFFVTQILVRLKYV
jgi:hypothetical protein